MFQLLWGARLDANRFIGVPEGNAALASALDVRTDRVPSSIAISPRLGITWYLVRDEAGGISTNASDLSRRSTTPSGMIRAGVGAFHGLYRPDALADADGSTGLPGAVQRLTCVGAAAPMSDWATYAAGAVPSAYASGAPVLADAAPAAFVLGPNFSLPRNWRASVGWTSRVGFLDYRVDATFALNRSQAGTIDRNLRASRAFQLASEGSRAVFVPATSIDAGSGAVSATASRVSPSFGTVAECVSDLRSHASTVTLSLNPDLSSLGDRDTFLSLNYTWASARTEARGLDAGAAGDPRLIEWARSPFDIRHQVIAQFARTMPWDIGVSLFLAL